MRQKTGSAIKTAAAFGALALGILGSKAHATAWTQPKGQGIVIIQEDRWSGTSGFDNYSGLYRFNNHGQSSVNQTNVYAEYGVTSKLTLVGSFWLNQIAYHSNNTSQSNFGFGDQQIGARYKMRPLGFLPSPWVGSSQVLVGFPTYKIHDQKEPLGTGGASVDIWHSIGHLKV